MESNERICSFTIIQQYLNAGAGSLGGAFMHNKHAHNDFPK